MPRPVEEEPKKPRGCWERITSLERFLVPITIISIIIIMGLLFWFAKKEVDFVLKYCNSTACVGEVSKITSYVDPEIDPCDDFYRFACGSFLENAKGNEELAVLGIIQDNAKRELLEAYMEPVQGTDHKMIKVAKELFRACMNQSEIEKDNLHTIREVVRAIGGWPAVEGSKWNDGAFNWVTTTYKLRELGYYHSIFLNLKAVVDPEDTTSYIFQVATPNMWDYSAVDSDKVEFMADVAVLFGAQDRKRAASEMAKVLAFLTKLQMEVHNQYGLEPPKKYTVKEYQKNCTTPNWFEFINKIASSPAEISEEDQVLFPLPETLSSWLDVITTTPKRVQANYMIWKVVEKAIPYLTEKIRSRLKSKRRRLDRLEFCLGEAQERFIPSPIDILCDRKYLSKEKRDKAEEVADNIKSELIAALERIQWMNKTDQEDAIARAKAIKIVVAQPDNYFDDKIFDELDVDMVSVKNKTFLNLIAQANRNFQTRLYRQIHQQPMQTKTQDWIYRNGGGLPLYAEDTNIIYIPAVSVSDHLFDETRPNYLNYGAFGIQVGQQLSGVFNKYLKDDGHEKRKCLEEAMADFNLQLDRFQIGTIMQFSTGGQLTYDAYINWIRNHGEEQHLITMKYTPRQLFWISAVLPICQPIDPHGPAQKVLFLRTFSSMLSGGIRNIPQLASDFKCPQGAKMNPAKRCSLV